MKCPKCGGENTEPSGYKNDIISESSEVPDTIEDFYKIVNDDLNNYSEKSALNFPIDVYSNISDPEDFDEKVMTAENPAMQECIDCGYRGDAIEFTPLEYYFNRKRMVEALE